MKTVRQSSSQEIRSETTLQPEQEVSNGMLNDYDIASNQVIFREFIQKMNELTDRAFLPLKCYLVFNLFWHFEQLSGKGVNTIPIMEERYRNALDIIKYVETLSFNVNMCPQHEDSTPNDDTDLENFLVNLYREVWLDFTDEIYFDEALALLKGRLEANDVDPYKLFKGKFVVDVGCGSGKWTYAIDSLGAKETVGIDIGREAIEFARSRKRPDSNCSFRFGNNLSLPLETNSVDFVFSNGVVHHTVDYEASIAELYRVLKPGGEIFIYVHGRGGLQDLHLDTLKTVCREIPHHVMFSYLKETGMHSGRVYWVLDNFYVEYERKTQVALESLLREIGFTDLKKLDRGLEFDWIERVTSGVPYAELMHGDGQLKYLAVKP